MTLAQETTMPKKVAKKTPAKKTRARKTSNYGAKRDKITILHKQHPNWTPAELANATGFSASYISRVLQGVQPKRTSRSHSEGPTGLFKIKATPQVSISWQDGYLIVTY